MTGGMILHYKILQKLGEGGMGMVYLADDTRLERKVALKFLPRHIAANAQERQRFEIEAKAAAALNHPNIAHIYAIEETDDDVFIVMEYIEGRELRDVVRATGPVAPTDAINIAIQIAAGLQAAHAKGIVHRDIKSGNIMITEEGQVKIMDFGLAKMGGGIHLTKTGTTLGTAAYMSPEQARGEEVDRRTDIWSFGVVLYEMLTGRLPFKSEYAQAVIYAILNEEPEPIAENVPEALQQIVSKTLEKELGARYQNAGDILSDLKIMPEKKAPSHKLETVKRTKFAIASFASVVVLAIFAFYFIYLHKDNSTTPAENSTAAIQRIAVLPFANLREDPETDFLGLALADEIIGDLSYINSLLVRPSSSVRQYQKQTVDAPTAGKELKVDFVLTGNYLKESEMIHLTVELVDVNSNEMLWRGNVEAKYENAFKLQDIVAEKVLNGLKVQFSPEERHRMYSDISGNPLAYEYYLRGLSYPYSNEGLQLAASMFEKSIELDSTFAPAWNELGFRKQLISYYVRGESQQLYEAEKANRKALSLNSELLSSLGQLIGIYTELGKADRAVETARRALAINPNSAENHFFLGYIYRFTGFLEEAEKEMQIALKLDPGNSKFRSIGTTYIYLGKYEQALEGFELDHGSPYCLGWQGQAYLRLGKKESALALLDRVIEMEPEGILGYWSTAMKAHLVGNPELGLVPLEIMENNLKDPEQIYNLANLYGLLGYKKRCVRALQKAVEGGFFNYPLFLTDSFLDSIRNEPGFQKVLAEAKSKHEAFKKKFF